MWLIMLKGWSGSGKSTVGRALSRQLGWPIIDKDDVKDLLDGQAEHAGGLAYDIMLNIARTQLRHGLSVICDSPFMYRKAYATAQAIAAETCASLAIVELRCSDEKQLEQRIEARKLLNLPSHHQTDWAAFREFLQRSPGEDFPLTHPLLVVDTVAPLYECVGKIVGWLEKLQSAAGTADAKLNYYLTLPKKRMGAGALLRNEQGEILIVHPTYRPEWLLPGGSIDEDESPLDCVRREVQEELGLAIPIERLLCVDYVYKEQHRTESLQFIFDGGTLNESEIQQIALPVEELSEYRFVPFAEAQRLLHPRIARRLMHCFQAGIHSGTIYMENSQPAW